MAQAEDTELRDLVIEALEKNGSLAKIRALLRANVFLAFENECENLKQNMSLDGILKLPEGILCLSLVHEFLEFCNLKNTLFVYMAESRQGREYVYEGQKVIGEKLNLRRENVKEPILVTLLRNGLKPYQRKYAHEKCNDSNYKDDQNCTYIVHEDSSSGSSNSDNSSDEKNKLHLRLQLDNSDTDTSSDSNRDKSSSEYIPSHHIAMQTEIVKSDNHVIDKPLANHGEERKNESSSNNYNNEAKNYLCELKLFNNSSSESTSYLDLKPYNPMDEKMLNTTGVPFTEADGKEILSIALESTLNLPTSISTQQSHISKVDLTSAATSSGSTMSANAEQQSNIQAKFEAKSSIDNSGKSDPETADYSYDFTSSPIARKIDPNKQIPSPGSIQDEFIVKSSKHSTFDSQQNSQSSQSSVSISDVADLISEKSSYSHQIIENLSSKSNNKSRISSHSKIMLDVDQNKLSDDSGDFSESPIPSLSNLSLDIHSD